MPLPCQCHQPQPYGRLLVYKYNLYIFPYRFQVIMNRPAYSNPPSLRLTSNASSIVEKLASRSITGRGLGIDIHRHTHNVLHRFWKSDSTTGCYTHFLERTQLEEGEDDLIQDYIVKAGLIGACECLSKWQPVPEESQLQPFLFWKQHIFHPLYPCNRRSKKKMRLFDCQCPEIELTGSKRVVTTSIICLNRNSQISSKVSHNSADVIRSRCFLLSVRSYIR